MHILYGVQGTGNGHISRASAMHAAFKRHYPDIKVTWLLSGREQRKGCGAIDHFLWREGITFVTGEGRVKMLPTLMKNNIFRFFRDVRELDLRPYDLVISDFEPVISHAARKRGIPVTGIGHQYAFDYAIPKEGNNPVVDTIMKNFAPVQTGIGLHWHHFNFPILPPIIDLVLPETMPRVQARKVIVYLPFDNLATVTRLLQHFPEFDFFIYHPDATKADTGNLHQRPISRDFKQDLLDAELVITNSGFELISECLHLGKRILCKPLLGQMEQLSNAAALKQLGYACVLKQLDVAGVGAWLNDGAKPVQIIYPDVQAELVRWIAEGQKETCAELAKKLWSATTPTV
jgi:uncharacterized protein (TIGR00661 family)